MVTMAAVGLWLLVTGCPGFMHAIYVYQRAIPADYVILCFHNNQGLASWNRQTDRLI